MYATLLHCLSSKHHLTIQKKKTRKIVTAAAFAEVWQRQLQKVNMAILLTQAKGNNKCLFEQTPVDPYFREQLPKRIYRTELD